MTFLRAEIQKGGEGREGRRRKIVRYRRGEKRAGV